MNNPIPDNNIIERIQRTEEEVFFDSFNTLGNDVKRRAGHVLVAYKEKLFLWGGYMEEAHYTTCNRLIESVTRYHKPEHLWIYESLIDVWYRKTCTGAIPDKLSGSSGAVIDNYLFIFGGYCFQDSATILDSVKNTLWRLDLENYEWKFMEPDGHPPIAADKATSWAYNGRLYVFGGFGCVDNTDGKYYTKPYSQVSFIAESESLVNSRGWFDQLVYYDTVTNKWEWPACRGTKPTSRAAHAVTVIKNKAFIFGGRHKSCRLNDFYSLDLRNHQWNILESKDHLPEGRSWHSLVAISDHQIVLYGGFSTVCKVLNDTWMYDLKSSEWLELLWVKSKPHLWHCSVECGSSEIVTVGGLSSNILDNTRPKDHAEDMLFIRFSPPSLFKLCLEYLTSRNRHKISKSNWNFLAPMLQNVLKARVDPFEVHGFHPVTFFSEEL